MPKQAYSPLPPQGLKPVHWVGSSLDDLRRLPGPVQDAVGYALFLAQCGETHPTAKRLRGDLQGLREVVDDFSGDTFRATYTTRLPGRVYVLHVFRKKATRGIATPRHVIEPVKARHRRAAEHHAATLSAGRG